MAEMDAVALAKTIYLGDRACKSLLIDGWNDEVRVQVDCISRVRGETWNFYTAEDIEDGFIVFENVKSVVLDPPGPLPDDYIDGLFVAETANDQAKYLFSFMAAATDASGRSTTVTVRTKAGSIALEDPKRPGDRVRL